MATPLQSALYEQTASGRSITVPLTNGTASGSTLILFCSGGDNDEDVTGISPGTWTNAIEDDTTDAVTVWTGTGVPAGTASLTVTLESADNHNQFYVDEWAGALTFEGASVPVDTTGATTSWASKAYTTTNANDIVYGYVTGWPNAGGAAITPSPSGSWINHPAQDDTSSGIFSLVSYQTPSATGSFTFSGTSTVSSSNFHYFAAVLAWRVAGVALSVATSAPAAATTGAAYSSTPATASNGTAPYTWSVASGSLPSWASLASSTGAISGTPTTAGSSIFTLKVTDSTGASATSASITITTTSNLTITTSSLAGGTVGASYSQALAASGGFGSDTWSATGLPSGLSVSGASITGTPAAAGTSSVVVTVKDAGGNSTPKTFSLTIGAAAPPTITTATLPGGTTGSAYSATLAASGGTGAHTWALASGSLPAGLALSAAGVIAGTPQTHGTSTLTVKVTDASGASATSGSLTIAVANNLANGVTALAAGKVGVAYSQPLPASGGYGAYTWSVDGGSLPDGLRITGSGTSWALTGTPTTVGIATGLVLGVHDKGGNGPIESAALSVTITPAPPAPPAAYGHLPGNLIPEAAQSNEGALAWSNWNAGTLSVSTAQSLDGVQSLAITSTAAGTGWCFAPGFNVTPGLPYVMSCYVRAATAGPTAVSMGYNQGGTLAFTKVTNAVTPSASGWTPLAGTFASFPATGNQSASPAVQVTFSAPGQTVYVDLAYWAQTDSQILIDWANPAFTPSSVAGSAFADVTPFVNVEINPISATRGRQDAISEVQNGSLNFTVDNPLGWFTQGKSTSPWAPNVTIGKRVQWNVAYRNGDSYDAFVTRFDGSLNEIDYTIAPNGTYATAQLNAQDVIAYLSQAPTLTSWTKQRVLLDNPDFHWTLDDQSGSKTARETSGNSGPTLTVSNRLAGGGGDFGQSQYGTETMADAPDINTPGSYATPVQGWSQTKVPTVASGTAGAGATALVGRLPKVYPIVSDAGWSLEFWAVYDPSATTNYATTNTARMGMVSLTDGDALYMPIWVSNSTATTQTVGAPIYSVTNSWAGTITNVGSIGNTAARWNATAAVPFHYVLSCSPAGTFTLYENGVALGSMTPSNLSQLTRAGFNQVVVGDDVSPPVNGVPVAAGFPGSISLVSLYGSALTAAQISAHYAMGWDGMYGASTGAVVGQIADYAGLPPFWQATPASGLGSMDYFVLGGQNALTAMQQAEQVELGLLYASAAGQLSFASRAARMGAGAPDVVLPMGSFTADLGAKVTNQYVQTSAALTGNASAVVAVSDSKAEARIGAYPNGDIYSPTALPVLTYAPASPAPDQVEPYAQDIVDWSVGVNSAPPFKVATLTVDVLTLADSADAEYVAPSVVAGLDINNVLSLGTAAQIEALPNATGALDFFVEGVTETYALGQHSIQFYTSPANAGRAWVPGDPAYGVLGSTAVVGVAQEAATAAPYSKRSAFDPGGPWLNPTFSATMNKGETDSGFVGMSDLRGITEQLKVMLSPPLFVGGWSWSGTTGPVIPSGQYVNLPLAPINDPWNGFNGLEATNSYWVVPVAGFYEICGLITFTQTPANTTVWDTVYGRVVVVDSRIGRTFQAVSMGAVNNATVGTPDTMYGRARCYLGVGARVVLEGYQYSAKPLYECMLSVQFIGFSEQVD